MMEGMEGKTMDAWLKLMRQMYHGFRKAVFFVWVSSDGTFLSNPDTDIENLQGQTEEMEKLTLEKGLNIRLCRYKFDRTEKLLCPPPDPTGNHHVGGGSAIGGHSCSTLVHVQEELEHLFGKLYKGDVTYSIKDDLLLTVEGGNVRVTIQLLSQEQALIDAESNSPMSWRVMLTMIARWNSDYHDQHVGDYCTGSTAADKAFLSFMRFQVEEACLDWF